jgi:hypothetical protein
MAANQEAARALHRDRGLRAVNSWTWTAGLAGAALTVVFALLAAGGFSGHQAAAAAPSVSGDATGNPDNSLPNDPQPAPQDSLRGSNRPPAAVSGGS